METADLETKLSVTHLCVFVDHMAAFAAVEDVEVAATLPMSWEVRLGSNG